MMSNAGAPGLDPETWDPSELISPVLPNRLSLFPALFPPILLQNLLPQTQRLRRHFDHLVFGDELDGLLKVESPNRHEADGLVGARGRSEERRVGKARR